MKLKRKELFELSDKNKDNLLNEEEFFNFETEMFTYWQENYSGFPKLSILSIILETSNFRCFLTQSRTYSSVNVGLSM